MTLDDFKTVLALAWSAETSSDLAWTPENAALGQCAVSALVLQDHFGGELLWAQAALPDGRAVSHYWNRLDGKDIDVTLSQFPPGTVIPAGVPKPGEYGSTRRRVLSFEATATRYRLLRERMRCASFVPGFGEDW